MLMHCVQVKPVQCYASLGTESSSPVQACDHASRRLERSNVAALDPILCCSTGPHSLDQLLVPEVLVCSSGLRADGGGCLGLTRSQSG